MGRVGAGYTSIARLGMMGVMTTTTTMSSSSSRSRGGGRAADRVVADLIQFFLGGACEFNHFLLAYSEREGRRGMPIVQMEGVCLG